MAGCVHESSNLLPDIPPGLHLISQVKIEDEGVRLKINEFIDEIEAAVSSELNSNQVEAFQRSFTGRYTPSKHCIQLRGDYE